MVFLPGGELFSRSSRSASSKSDSTSRWSSAKEYLQAGCGEKYQDFVGF